MSAGWCWCGRTVRWRGAPTPSPPMPLRSLTDCAARDPAPRPGGLRLRPERATLRVTPRNADEARAIAVLRRAWQALVLARLGAARAVDVAGAEAEVPPRRLALRRRAEGARRVA